MEIASSHADALPAASGPIEERLFSSATDAPTSEHRLSREQRKLLEQLRDTLPIDNSPSEKGLFEKVKDYFM